MNNLGLLGFIAGALQLTIPSYAFRLIRRFGPQKVGWFIVTAFACLGLVHLLDPVRTARGGFGSAMSFDALYAVASILLLVGMAHLDTIISSKLDAARDRARLQHEAERQIKEKVTALQQRNEELAANIAVHRQRERGLEESEARYRFLFVQYPQPMWILDLRTCRFLAVNKAALAQHGFTEQEFMALGAADIVSAEARDAFLQNINQPCFGVDLRGCWPLRRKDGTMLEAEITAVDLKYGENPARLIMAADTASRRREQKQLLETERLKLIGSIAGGVAHHFNNILTIISGRTELLLHVSPDKETSGQVEAISAAVDRGASLTRQLLAAAGEHMLDLVPLNVNNCLRRLDPMLQRLVGERILIETRFAPDLPLAMADVRALDSIIVGLVLNARDAMHGQGRLALSTKAVRITEFEARSRTDIKAGEFVTLEVRDTGCGMTPDTRARLFQPFFTTKDIGKASGLGLASAFGLLKQHAGAIECVSELGKGTQITMYLPCAPRTVAANAPMAKLSSGTVLLVEPDDRVRALARYILNRKGYTVIECDGAEIALSLWESQQSRIDLVLTEHALPGAMSGSELVENLRAAKPGLKALYTCSAPEAAQQENGMLVKPLVAETLLDRVERAFGHPAV